MKTMRLGTGGAVTRRVARLGVALGLGITLAWAAIQNPVLWAATFQIGANPGAAASPTVAPAGNVSASASLSLGSARSGPSGAGGDGAVPAFRHVYWVVMQNHNLVDVAGSGQAPYLASLLKRSALAANYHAVASVSLPNHIALLSGSVHGITDSAVHYLDAVNLMDQLEQHGRTWAVYAQNVPTSCFLGETAANGPDGAGTYVRRHDPAVSFTSIVTDPARCARITNLSHFRPGLADFSLIIPNLCNSMHDCSIAVGDAFLRRLLQRIITAPSWSAQDAIFLTFDEGGDSNKAGVLVFSGTARAGVRSNVWHDHYSLLRTVEDAWGLGCLEQACTAGSLAELFRPDAR